MTDLLVTVLCYQGDVLQVEHQLEYYLHHGAPILLLSPEDSPACVEHPRVKCKSRGLNGWAGRGACYRFHSHLRLMLEEPHDWFLLCEPDSVCLSPTLPDYLFERTDVMTCVPFGSRETGDYNTPPPWFGHREVWEQIVAVMDDHIEEWLDHSDRLAGWGHNTGELIATSVATGEVKADVYRDAGWAHNEHDNTGLFQAAERGALFYTGFKKPETFDALVSAYEASKP